MINNHNEGNPIMSRKLRHKRPARVMVDGTYEVTAYWGNDRALTTRTIEVDGGVARYEGEVLGLALQAWLRDQHIPTLPDPHLLCDHEAGDCYLQYDEGYKEEDGA